MLEAMPDPTDTQRLRAIFSERAETEAERAEESPADAERRAAERRAEKATYLEQKLAEQAEADDD